MKKIEEKKKIPRWYLISFLILSIIFLTSGIIWSNVDFITKWILVALLFEFFGIILVLGWLILNIIILIIFIVKKYEKISFVLPIFYIIKTIFIGFSSIFYIIFSLFGIGFSTYLLLKK